MRGSFQPKNVILLDSDKDTIQILERILTKPAFDLFCVTRSSEAMALFEAHTISLIISEIQLKDTDGISFIHTLKQSFDANSTKFIILTSHEEEYTEIAAFNEGVDDYIQKPVRPAAFMKRIDRLLFPINRQPGNILKGNWNLDEIRQIVYHNQQAIPLPAKTFELFQFLIYNEGVIFSREELIQQVWNNDLDDTSRTVDVHIRKLRERIGDAFIITYKGIGYMFKDTTGSG